MSVPTSDELDNMKQQSRRTLTMTQKIKMLDTIVDRDGGFVCFYCKQDLSLDSFDFEHLNNIPSDDRVENLVFSCHPCNVRKIHDESLQLIASKKLEQNIVEKYLREKKSESQDTDAPIEIRINVSANKITRNFIEEEISKHGYVLWKDALDCSVYLIQEQTNHGSTPSVSRYLDVLTSKVAPYDKITNEEGKKIIVRRNVEKTIDAEKEIVSDTTKENSKKPTPVIFDKKRLITPENERKITGLSEILHNVEECEACEIVKEYKERTEILHAIYDKTSSDEQEKMDPDIYSTVGHCSSFFCDHPVFDGDHWCGRCVNFWSKMMCYPKEREIIGV